MAEVEEVGEGWIREQRVLHHRAGVDVSKLQIRKIREKLNKLFEVTRQHVISLVNTTKVTHLHITFRNNI